MSDWPVVSHTARSLVGRGARPATAAFIGAGIPLSGFSPLNNAGNWLAVQTHPALSLLMPASLVAILALCASLAWPSPKPRPVDRWLRWGFALLILGAFLSLLQTENGSNTSVRIVTGVLAPLVLFIGLRRAALPGRIVAGALVAVSVLLMLRADGAFFVRDGWPTGDTLLRVKNLYRPHDFHYYGLQNPIPTAMFVVIVLTFSAMWLIDERQRPLRWLAISAVAVSVLTLYLLYIRIGLILGIIVVGYTVVARRSPHRALLGFTAVVAVALAFVMLSGPSARVYVRLLDISSEARVESLGSGLRALLHHPITGLGLGWAEQGPTRTPSHSDVVQAGMEMGVSGFAGVALLTVGMISLSLRELGSSSRCVIRRGALVAAGLYAFYAAIAGGVDAGISSGFVSVWSLTIAALLAMAMRDERATDRSATVEPA